MGSSTSYGRGVNDSAGGVSSTSPWGTRPGYALPARVRRPPLGRGGMRHQAEC